MEDVNRICEVKPSKEQNNEYGKSSYTKSIFYPTTSTVTGYSKSVTSRTDVYTYYKYTASNYLAKTTKLYKLLFRDNTDSSNISYVLASRCTGSSSSGSYFFIRQVNSEELFVQSAGSGYTTRFEETAASNHIRPIVYLKSTIQTNGKNSSGAWNIIDK